MKAKQIFLSVLFIFLSTILFTSCEKENIVDEPYEKTDQFEKKNIQQIDREDVEDPGDRGSY